MSVFTRGPYGRLAVVLNTLSSINIEIIIIIIIIIIMPSFVEMGPVVPEKKNFKGFFTIYGHGGHLDHVTWIIYKHIDSLFP